jgi:Ca-activated chloride channel family protein
MPPGSAPQEREAAQQVINFLRSQPTQELAARLGLRPGVPGVPLGAQFTPANGVTAQPTYNSLRPPSPEVVTAMLKWLGTGGEKALSGGGGGG